MPTQIQSRELYMKQGMQDGKWRVFYFVAIGSEQIAECDAMKDATRVTGIAEHETKYQQLTEASNHG